MPSFAPVDLAAMEAMQQRLCAAVREGELPAYARMLLAAQEYGCVRPVALIAALTAMRLVYAGVFGFGQDGPYADRPGVDPIVQGMGGHMMVTGEPGRGPMRSGAALSDVGAGLLCANGILTALLERETTK